MRAWLFAFVVLCASSCFAKTVTVQEFEDSQTPLKILVFISDICPCSQNHREHLNNLAKRFPLPQFQFFAVISEPVTKERVESAAAYFSDTHFQFPIIADPQQVLVKKYHALKTPHVTILKRTLLEKKADNPLGDFKVIYEGGVSNDRDFSDATVHYLEDNLIALKEHTPLKHKNGMSLGCYIRRI